MMARPKLRVRKIAVVAAPMMEVELPADSDVQGVELASLLEEGSLRQFVEIYIVAPEGVPEVLRSAWLVPVEGEVPSAAAEAERLGVVSRLVEDKVAGAPTTRPVTCVVLLETQDQARHRHSARRSW